MYDNKVMPELPEVETVRLQLRRVLIGKTIVGFSVFKPTSNGIDKRLKRVAVGHSIVAIDRVGKLLIFKLDGSGKTDKYILIHLKMTGQLLYTSPKGDLMGGGHTLSATDIENLPGRHTRAAFHFQDGSHLYFNDLRRFGYIKSANGSELAKTKARFGPEPIDPELDRAALVRALRQRKTFVKAALLDQTLLAGLGNIYVDEALFAVGVRPTRRANRLKKNEAEALIAAAADVLRLSIKVGGTTFQHFRNSSGQKGNFTKHLQVFGRTGKDCPICGTPIKKLKVVGRGTHYCPTCQK